MIWSSAMQMALLLGGLVGLGVALIVWGLAPAHMSAKDFVDRIVAAEAASRTPVRPPVHAEDFQGRLGLLVERHIPLPGWIKIPQRDLDLLDLPRYRFLGEKAAFGIAGLCLPSVLGVLLPILGIRIPLAVPAAAALLLGLAATFLADIDIRDDAAKARLAFRHALTAYIDLVAVALSTGSAPHQAAMQAAQLSDSWAFRLIAQELSEATLSGHSAWDNLDALGERIGIPELGDLADTMRLSAEDSAAVYAALLARANNLRDQLQTSALAAANTATENMTVPSTLLLASLLGLIAFPFLMKLITR